MLDWHDRRPRASLQSPRGWIWLVLIVALFYWMSNPLVYIPSFYLSLEMSVKWTTIAVIVTLPWLRLPRIPWPWLLFIGLCFASQWWTINDFNTDVSDTVYLQIAVMAWLVAANCEPLLVCWGLGMGGVVVVALSVHAFNDQVPGSFNIWYGGVAGVGTNENILAYTLALSLSAVCAIGLPRHLVARVVWLGTIGVNGYGMYLSRSGTGIFVTLCIFVAAAVVVAWPRLRSRGRGVLLAWLASTIGILAIGLVVLTKVLDKDVLSLSGRADFWRATIDASLDLVPWLGAGWGAVWEHPWNGAPYNHVAEQIYLRAGYPLPHGHNFFIDVLPELGLAGVTTAVLMVLYAISTIRRASLRSGRDPVSGRLVLFALIALLITGITEPMLTVPLGFWCFALVVATARQRVLPKREGDRRGTRTPGARRAAAPATRGRP